MIKILKWELLKEFNTLKWGFAAILFFLFIFSTIPVLKLDGTYGIFIVFSNIAMSITCFFFMFFYPTISLVLELRQPYSLLEKTIPQPFVKILIARCILNTIIFLIGLGIGFLEMKIMSRFNNNYLSLGSNIISTMIYSVFIYPIIIHFLYLLCTKMPITNLYPFIATVIFSVVFIRLSILINGYISDFNLILFEILIALFSFYGSCKLYEKSYSPI